MNIARTTVIVTLAALAMAAAWLGCGVKSLPIPPEDARPARILDLRAVSENRGVELSWGRPDTYASGAKMRDLGSFWVMRSDTQGQYRKVTEIPVTDRQRFQVQRRFSYLDSATEVGHAYSYRVVARTTDGYESEPSNEVALTRTVPRPPPNPETFVLPTPTPVPLP
jgi:hypothetical protein